MRSVVPASAAYSSVPNSAPSTATPVSAATACVLSPLSTRAPTGVARSSPAVRAASAEDFTFSAPVTGMGNWLFEGPLDVNDGKFQQTFVSGNARLQVWGTVDGDHVTIGGQVKVTGFYEQGNTFRIEGKFQGEKYKGNFVETLNYGQNLRGQITMTRPVAQTAPAPAAPTQQAVVSPPKQTATACSKPMLAGMGATAPSAGRHRYSA